MAGYPVRKSELFMNRKRKLVDFKKGNINGFDSNNRPRNWKLSTTARKRKSEDILEVESKRIKLGRV